jgi:hypothetical protein
MMTDEFQQIWKAYDSKLERSLQLNLRLLNDMQTQKAKSALKFLVAMRVVGIVGGILWALLLGVLLYYVRSQPVMAVSFAVFILCTVVGIWEYIRDIHAIRQLSYADNIIDTQEKLVGLRSSIIRTLRLMWLQLPFWSTFFISDTLIKNGGRQFLLIQVPITLFFVIADVILYRNITVENADKKKWVKWMIRGSGTGSVARAMDFMKEIDEFKKN